MRRPPRSGRPPASGQPGRAPGSRSPRAHLAGALGRRDWVYRVLLPGTVQLMEHVQWVERPQLRDPALVCAFKGWNDAGESASAALGYLIDSFDADEVP